jgi:preprotein translocase subunit YajC
LPFCGYLVSLTVFPLPVMRSFTVLAEVPVPVFTAFRTLAQTPAPAAPPAPAGADAPQPSVLANLIVPLMLLGVFFLVFAPQMKRNKEHKKLLDELKAGDDVITSGGIHGEIVQVKPDRFVVEIAKGVRIEINRANVEARAPAADASVNPKV